MDRNGERNGHIENENSSSSSSSSSDCDNSNGTLDDTENNSSEILTSASSEILPNDRNYHGRPVLSVNSPSRSRVRLRNATRTPQLPQTSNERPNLPHSDGIQVGFEQPYNPSAGTHAASTQRLEEELGTYHYENVLIRTELAREVELRQQEIQQLERRHRIELSAAERERDEAVAELQRLECSTTLNERKLHEKNILLHQKLVAITEELSRVKDELTKCDERQRQQAQCHATASITRDTDLATQKAAAGAARAEAVRLQEQLDAEKQRCDGLRVRLQEQASLQRQVDDAQRQCREQVESAQAEVAQLQQELHQQHQQHRTVLQELEAKRSRAEEQALAAQRNEGSREAELLSQLEALREQKQSADTQVLHLKEQLFNAQQMGTSSSGDGQYRLQPQPALLQQVQLLTHQLQELQTENITLQLSEKEHAEVAAELKSAQDQVMSLKKQLSQLKASSAAQQHTISTLEKDLAVSQEEEQKVRKARDECEKSLSRLLRNVKEEAELQRSQFTEETSNLKSRIQVLESRLMEKDKKYHAETKSLKIKYRKYGSLIHKLRHRLQTSNLHQEQMQARLEALQTNWVDPQQFTQLRQELKLLLSKHTEFQAFVRGVQGARGPEEEQTSELMRRATSFGDRLTELEHQLNRLLCSSS